MLLPLSNTFGTIHFLSNLFLSKVHQIFFPRSTLVTNRGLRSWSWRSDRDGPFPDDDDRSSPAWLSISFKCLSFSILYAFSRFEYFVWDAIKSLSALFSWVADAAFAAKSAAWIWICSFSASSLAMCSSSFVTTRVRNQWFSRIFKDSCRRWCSFLKTIATVLKISHEKYGFCT